jgi:hypothetical protein
MSKRRDVAEYARQALLAIRVENDRLPIFHRPLPSALYNYVAVADVDVLKAIATDPALAVSAHRRLVESGAQAIPSLYHLCDRYSPDTAHVSEELFSEAHELFEFSYRLDQIQYAYDLANRGQFKIFVAQKEPRITFAYTSQDADHADTRLRALEHQEIRPVNGREDDNKRKESEEGLLKELGPLVTATRRADCRYSHSDKLIEIMRQHGRDKLARTNRLELPDDLRLGDFTVHDIRMFWAALMAISEVHTAAHMIGANWTLDSLPINTLVLRKRPEEFVELISLVAELSTQTATQLLTWYTYDHRVAGGTPILQPFLPLEANFLCLPSSFVNGNRFERNLMKLFHRHPDLLESARALERALEPTALDSLSQLFPEPRYSVRSQVEIPGVTDVDLLLFDSHTSFVLAIQHKWIIAPDTVNESAANDEKLAAGVTQATSARDYLRDDLPFLRRTIDVSAEQEITGIEAAVVCRGSEGTGFLGTGTAVPILSENAFKLLLRQSPSLSELWNLLNRRPDHERAEKASTEGRAGIRLCGYEFVLPALAVEVPGRSSS